MPEILRPRGLLFKRVLLLFGAIYFSMITLTNTVNLLDELDVLSWTFLDSQYFGSMRDATGRYDLSVGVVKALLIGVVAIEAIGAALFWRALARLRENHIGIREVYEAHIWAALVWLLFIFSTEFFIVYSAESVFRELMAITILSMLSVTVVPDDLPDRQIAVRE